VYENNTSTVIGKDILINGKKTDSYTLNDYYWMMATTAMTLKIHVTGGFVPETIL